MLENFWTDFVLKSALKILRLDNQWFRLHVFYWIIKYAVRTEIFCFHEKGVARSDVRHF